MVVRLRLRRLRRRRRRRLLRRLRHHRLLRHRRRRLRRRRRATRGPTRCTSTLISRTSRTVQRRSLTRRSRRMRTAARLASCLLVTPTRRVRRPTTLVLLSVVTRQSKRTSLDAVFRKPGSCRKRSVKRIFKFRPPTVCVSRRTAASLSLTVRTRACKRNLKRNEQRKGRSNPALFVACQLDMRILRRRNHKPQAEPTLRCGCRD